MITIKNNNTIKQALEKLGSSEGLRILIVLNEEDRFIGIIADPDIRKALLRGVSLDDNIKSVINYNPIVANVNDAKEKIFEISVKHNVYQIPIVNNEGQVVRIEQVIHNLVATPRDNKVVIMAGGLGMRLRPLTENLPKPMLPIGKKPILQIIVERFKKQGFTDIVLCVNYKAEVIESYFGNGEKYGVKITYVYEKKRMGTAGALSLLEDIGNNPVLVVNGDVLTNVDYNKILEFHNEKKSLATMGVREYSYQNPYGVIREDKGIIVAIEEKPNYTFLVNSGIYVLETDIISRIPKNQFFDMPSLFEKLMDTNRIHSYLIEDYWIDIGRLEEYNKASMDYVIMEEKNVE